MRANLIWVFNLPLVVLVIRTNKKRIQLIERQVNTLKMTEKNNKDNKQKDKLPFAVFICPKSNVGDTQDYKQVFTDIISDRIQEKYKQKMRTKFRKNIEKD